MSEYTYTFFLEVLLERSKTVGKAENAPLTAERFLVAAFDFCETEELLGFEPITFRQRLNRAFPDQEKARLMLMGYIDSPATKMFLDDLYMKARLSDAQKLSQEYALPAITSKNLLQSILESPSPVIKSAMGPEETEKKEEKTEETSEETELFFDDLFEAVLEDDELFGSPISPKDEVAQIVEDVKRIRTELRETVFGQDNAVNLFVGGYFQARMRAIVDKENTRPQATFLFAGPPGVGKTFLAETIADTLNLPFRRFDMSEYADKESNLEFCGSDKVYRNGKSGNVTSFVEQNPKCVLLFDEIEKAHMCVIHLFLQMLDAGRLRDNYSDREVSFADTIIILTTNAGRQLYEESESGDLSGVSRKVILNALKSDINPTTNATYFPGAICSRFASGNVVMFNHISAHNLHSIAKKEIKKNVDNMQIQTGITLDIEDQVYTSLLFAEGSAADARTIRSRAQTFFHVELYELLRLIASDKTRTGIGAVEDVRVCVDLEGVDPEILRLYKPEQDVTALVFAESQVVADCKEIATNVRILGTQSCEEAIALLKDQDIGFVLLDVRYGTEGGEQDVLNVEDVASAGRKFFKFLRNQRNAPAVYLLETQGKTIHEEEMISFHRQGARGTLNMATAPEETAQQLSAIARNLHQQASMMKLARENKVVSFETAQQLSKDGKHARIKLFDFELTVAVDSEDSKNVLSAVSRPNVRFDQVIGAQDAKEELAYFVEYLREPKKYMGTGVKAPKGVLLYGPPGTGKTMLAKAMACEADVTFIAAEGNQFLKQHVGEGAEYVHKLFRTARKYAPSVLFIDEIDAIAKERTGRANGEETLTAFLTEMDGFVSDPSRPVFVLAATNFDVEPGRSKSLDPALMRRFDRRIYIDLPDRNARLQFLNMKIQENEALDISKEQLDQIALRSTGMSLAELDSVVELALRSAIRAKSTKVTDAILSEALETFNGGAVTKWSEDTLERVARHEAGHTLLCWLGGNLPSYVTVVSRGDHGGYMHNGEQENKQLYTKDELLANIRTALAGRAAEIVYYGPQDGISTGAGGDLVSATRTAQYLLCSCGMDEEFGLAVVPRDVAADGAMSVQVRQAVNRILAEQLQETIRLISANRAKMDVLVAELVKNNQLSGRQIEAILKDGGASRITGQP